MRSKITIELDFQNGNVPVIQILKRESDDVKDKILHEFLQSLQHTSEWCRIEYLEFIPPVHKDDPSTHRWVINPIKVRDLTKERDLINSIIEEDNSTQDLSGSL